MGMSWKIVETTIDSCCGARAEKVASDIARPRPYYPMYGTHWETLELRRTRRNVYDLPGWEDHRDAAAVMNSLK